MSKFYNGQRKTILKELKRHPGLQGNTYFNVFTIDSYQGEENDIILLSLVRSNEHLGIGFLESRNRLVVALSRARRGLYLFGNAITLTAAETSDIGWGRDVLWTPLINFLKEQGRFDLDGGFPITCSNHGTIVSIMEADEWFGLAGGCDTDCGGILPCGHNCPLKCHPFDHEMVFCRIPCPRKLACGHFCSLFCSDICECSQCKKIIEDTTTGDHQPSRSSLTSDHREKSSLPTSGKYSQYNIPRVHFFGTQNDTYPPHSLASGSSSRAPTLKPSMMTKSSGPGSPGQWQNWDAVKSDAEMAEKLQQMEATKSTTDYSKIVFKDTWRPVSLKNGERVVSKPERQFIQQSDTDAPSAMETASITPELKIDTVTTIASRGDEDLTDIIAQMPKVNLNLSRQGPKRGSSTSIPPNIDDGDGAHFMVRPVPSDPNSTNMGGNELHPSSPAAGPEYIESRRSRPYSQPCDIVEGASAKVPPAQMNESEDLIDLSNAVNFSPVSSGSAQNTASAAADLLI